MENKAFNKPKPSPPPMRGLIKLKIFKAIVSSACGVGRKGGGGNGGSVSTTHNKSQVGSTQIAYKPKPSSPPKRGHIKLKIFKNIFKTAVSFACGCGVGRKGGGNGGSASTTHKKSQVGSTQIAFLINDRIKIQ